MRISAKARLDSLGIDTDMISGATIETFNKAVAGIAKGAQAEWIRLAQNRLKSSRQDYINGLRQAESFSAKMVGSTSVFEIKLVGRMPNNFEFGMAGFDMKSVRPGWLGSQKAKTGKDGKKYITIPFRHSISSAASLAYSGKAAAADLKTELKRTVKQYGLDRMMRAATGQVIEGPVARVPKNPDIHRYLHGLTKIQTAASGTTKSGQQRGSSQLLTFRIMSENSAPDSWLHPGIKPANILPEVERWVENEFDNVLQMIVEAAV